MKPRALDLFCGAGGATRGLQQAGFHVTGVDIAPQPNYCGDEFIQLDARDALSFMRARMFDFIWASPPCQQFTAYRRKNPAKVGASAPNLIPTMRIKIARYCVPSVIENVPGAPLFAPVTLCGSMFGLDVRRHRCFETSFAVIQPPCNHNAQRGSYPPATNRKNRRKTVEVGVYRIPLATQQKAMGIDWMNLKELSQAIPPAYAKYIGEQALAAIRRTA